MFDGLTHLVQVREKVLQGYAPNPWRTSAAFDSVFDAYDYAIRKRKYNALSEYRVLNKQGKDAC